MRLLLPLLIILLPACQFQQETVEVTSSPSRTKRETNINTQPFTPQPIRITVQYYD